MTEATTASPALIPFTERQEGKVHRAYRDSGGVVTIGVGFTGLSKVFAAYWQQAHGHKLRMGDMITDAECDLMLGRLLEQEYGPPVAKRFKGTGILQREFDAATDMSFNCGAGSLKWTWAGFLAQRQVTQAAARLKTTAVTAGGRKLAGLVRRRADEARLMTTGDYGSGAASQSTSKADIAAYQQQLATLGLYTGAVDGVAGDLTTAAVKAFQRGNDLVVDGIVGPATRAALQRAVEARRAGQAAVAAPTAGAAAGGAVEAQGQAAQVDWSTLVTALEWGLAIGAVLLVGILIWRNRGVILRKRTPA